VAISLCFAHSLISMDENQALNASFIVDCPSALIA